MINTKRVNICLTLGLLIFIFIGPLLLAIGLYLKTPHWLKLNTLNKGKLISPPIDFSSINKKIIYKSKSLKCWQVFYLSDKECRHVCRQRLYTLQQIIKALGKNSWQLRAALIQITPSAIVYKPLIDSYSISALEYKKNFTDKQLYGGYYLIDKQKKIILYYPTNTLGEELYQDLLRLI